MRSELALGHQESLPDVRQEAVVSNLVPWHSICMGGIVTIFLTGVLAENAHIISIKLDEFHKMKNPMHPALNQERDQIPLKPLGMSSTHQPPTPP